MVCGICGSVSRGPIHDVEPVKRMRDALRHRGPDGEGSFRDAHVALGMRRLSIIDLTGGWQPLYNEDRSLVLVANGEIYNFVELRAELESRGHRFATGSDCETILHLYEEDGCDCVHRLRGMFAFALWDGRCRRLILARDRMGEKPLYLWERDGQLTFASELKALVQTGVVPFELDPHAIDLYFHYHYVPEPFTPIKGVRKLPAAHTLTVNVDPWRVTESRYWCIEDAPPLDGDPGELIRAELDTIGELAVRADVPVGVALSAGLDSGALAALAARKVPGTMHAFSVGYPHRPPYDERADAQALAADLGLAFHDVEITTEEMVDSFPDLIKHRDDPIADISGHCYYAVMKRARAEGVPVVLQGQGADELFWGYPWVRQGAQESLQKLALWRKGWTALPHYLRPGCPAGRSARDLWSWARSCCGLRDGWDRYRRHRADPPDRLVFYDLPGSFRMAHAELGGLYTPAFAESLGAATAFDLFTFPQPWPQVDLRITRLICDTYLQENGITQGDRLSMASSVELRLPFVDHRLVETVIGLRKSRADLRLPPKAWLKAAVKDLLPGCVLNRPKQGFAPPLSTWHRALFAAYGATLDDGYLVGAGVLDPNAARKLVPGPFPDSVVVPLSFKALVLETWCRAMAHTSSDEGMRYESRAEPARAVCA